MKKTFISAIVLLIVFAFTSCDLITQTKEEMLTTKNGWIMTAATSDPPYESLGDEKYVDLFKNYFYDYEKDDVYIYTSDGALKVDPGKLLPKEDQDGYTKIETLGQWVLSGNKLTTKVPGFYDKDANGTWTMDKVDLIDITETTLKYSFEFDATRKNKNAKAGERYVWTFTFAKK
jgi:hypothetical protein